MTPGRIKKEYLLRKVTWCQVVDVDGLRRWINEGALGWQAVFEFPVPGFFGSTGQEVALAKAELGYFCAAYGVILFAWMLQDPHGDAVGDLTHGDTNTTALGFMADIAHASVAVGANVTPM